MAQTCDQTIIPICAGAVLSQWSLRDWLHLPCNIDGILLLALVDFSLTPTFLLQWAGFGGEP